MLSDDRGERGRSKTRAHSSIYAVTVSPWCGLKILPNLNIYVSCIFQGSIALVISVIDTFALVHNTYVHICTSN